MKRCTKCGQDKPLTDFHKNKRSKDGLQYWCKPCVLSDVPREPIEVEAKRCRDCGATKAASEFHSNKRAKDGLQPYCKPCNSARANKPREHTVFRTEKRCSKCSSTKPAAEFYRNNRTSDRLCAHCKVCMDEASRAHQRGNPVRAARAKVWREQNSEHVRDYYQRYYAENYEYIRAKGAEWQKNNPEKSRIRNQRRRARKRSVETEMFSKQDLTNHFDDIGAYACVYCDGPYQQDDHVVPISKGGPHTIDNMVPSCKTCNIIKKDTDPVEFISRVIEAMRSGKPSIYVE